MDNIYKTVWRLIPKSETRKIAAASQKLRKIDESWNPYPTPRGFCFAQQDMRHAYYYCYFTCNTYAIGECWRLFYTISYHNNQHWDQIEVVKWFDTIKANKRANLFCLGGGAGFEVIGICKWLKIINVKIKLYPFLVDKYHWAVDTQPLLLNLDNTNVYNLRQTRYTTYKTLSELKTNDELMEYLERADIVTMVKFLSARDHSETDTETTNELVRLLENMKSGAMLFFMDNIRAENLEKMRCVAESAKLKKIAEIGCRLSDGIPDHEHTQMMINNFKPTMPHESTIVCASLWQKP